MDHVCLAEQKGLKTTHPASVEAFLKEKVLELIQKAREQWEEEEGEREMGSEEGRPEFPKPLIRLKVDYSGGFSTLNTQRFGQQFADQVANPREILHFHRRRSNSSALQLRKEGQDGGILDVGKVEDGDKMDELGVVDLVKQHLEDQGQSLEILPASGMDEAVRQFTDKEEREAIRM